MLIVILLVILFLLCVNFLIFFKFYSVSYFACKVFTSDELKKISVALFYGFVLNMNGKIHETFEKEVKYFICIK